MTLLLTLLLWLISPTAQAALDCDGSNDYVAVDASTTLDATSTGFSVGAWIYVNAAGEQSIIGRRGPGFSPGAGGYQLRVQDAAFPLTVRCVVKSAASGDEAVFDYDNISQNTWTHVACTFNNSTDAVELYVNGVDQGGGSTTRDPATTPTTVNLAVCDDYAYGGSPPGNNLDGQIEDAFFSNAVLSANDVAIIALSRGKRMPLQFSGMQMLLPLDDCGSGATCPSGNDAALDLTSNRNGGDYTGSPVGAAGVLTYP